MPNDDQMETAHRDQHTETLVLSFLGIRRAIGLLGFSLPLILGPIGYWVFGVPIQDNMSSYYHTVLRDVFVGVMCSIGVFLFCYRGHDRWESWNGNVGCAAAIGIAIFPLDPNSDPLLQRSILGYLHTLSGGLFFFSLAIYSIFFFPATCDDQLEAFELTRCNYIFRLSGLVLLSSIIAMGVYLFLLPSDIRRTLTDYKFLFWMEWVAVWAFAGAWLTKGRILSLGWEIVKRQRMLFHR